MSGLSDTSAFEAFNRMAEKIEEQERRSLAATEVTEALRGDTLEQQFVRLESGDEAEGRLLALKREMGLLPPAEEEEAPRLTAGDEEEDDSHAKETEPDGQIREAELLEEFDRLEQQEST